MPAKDALIKVNAALAKLKANKSVKLYLEAAALQEKLQSKVETAGLTKKGWDKLTSAQKKKYLKANPNSRYGKPAKAPTKKAAAKPAAKTSPKLDKYKMPALPDEVKDVMEKHDAASKKAWAGKSASLKTRNAAIDTKLKSTVPGLLKQIGGTAKSTTSESSIDDGDLLHSTTVKLGGKVDWAKAKKMADAISDNGASSVHVDEKKKEITIEDYFPPTRKELRDSEDWDD